MSPEALAPPERPLTGYQEVLDYLRREMSLGRIRVGDRLPSERCRNRGNRGWKPEWSLIERVR